MTQACFESLVAVLNGHPVLGGGRTQLTRTEFLRRYPHERGREAAWVAVEGLSDGTKLREAVAVWERVYGEASAF